MARKPDDEDVFLCVCQVCGIEGPRRATALWAVESANRVGWHVQADVQLCTRCGYRVSVLERNLKLPATQDRDD